MNTRYSPDITDLKNYAPSQRPWYHGPVFMLKLAAAAACGYGVVIALMSIA